MLPITDLMLLSGRDDELLEPPQDYELLPANLNEGGDKLGAQIYLCYRRNINGSPITQVPQHERAFVLGSVCLIARLSCSWK